MTTEALLELFTSVTIWKRGNRRAPHKPLLLLFLLGRIQQTQSSSIRYTEIEKPLGKLIVDFGVGRTSKNPHYPFWHLKTDGFWLVRDADKLKLKKAGHSPTKTEIRAKDPEGMLSPEIEKMLNANPGLIVEAAHRILEENFPSTVHDDILAEIGLDVDVTESVSRKKRDPAFREKVLRAYERQCAVCGFDLRLGTSDLALEAAHIMWRQAGGPDIEPNGLALCSIHHKMLDKGAYTVSNSHRVQVSQEVCGSSGMDEYLMQYHGKKIRDPQSPEYRAHPEYLDWHGQVIFKSPGRPD